MDNALKIPEIKCVICGNTSGPFNDLHDLLSWFKGSDWSVMPFDQPGYVCSLGCYENG